MLSHLEAASLLCSSLWKLLGVEQGLRLCVLLGEAWGDVGCATPWTDLWDVTKICLAFFWLDFKTQSFFFFFSLFKWKKSYDKPRQHIKNRDITLLRKVCIVKVMIFSVVLYWWEELSHKEGWVQKNWCFWTVVLEKTLDSPLDSKEIQPVHPKGDQSWIFIGRTDAEAEAPILWSPDAKNQLIGKDPDAGKDWRWEEKGMTQNEMVGWHHQLNGHEFE